MWLAFDTSTGLGSVALGPPGGEPAARRLLRRQGAHAAALVPAIRELLEAAGVARGAIEAVVVGAGPGSFTGLRVAAATAKGLVRGLDVPLRAVSSLAAGAVTAGLEVPGLGPAVVGADERDRPRCVLFDARGERVYAASYRIAADRIETVREPRASRIGAVLDEGPDPATLFCGDGARRHRERLEARGYRVLGEPAGVPTADALLRIGGMEPGAPRVEEPARWQPEYLRAWRSGPEERKAG